MTKIEALKLFYKEGVLVKHAGGYSLASDWANELDNALGKHKPSTKIDITKLSTEYRELWPKGVHSGNRPVRQSVNSIKKKMTTFLHQRRDVSVEEILEATEIYVKTLRRKGWEYMQCSDYFIMKNGSSLLESYVDQLKEGDLVSPGEQTTFKTLN